MEDSLATRPNTGLKSSFKPVLGIFSIKESKSSLNADILNRYLNLPGLRKNSRIC